MTLVSDNARNTRVTETGVVLAGAVATEDVFGKERPLCATTGPHDHAKHILNYSKTEGDPPPRPGKPSPAFASLQGLRATTGPTNRIDFAVKIPHAPAIEVYALRQDELRFHWPLWSCGVCLFYVILDIRHRGSDDGQTTGLVERRGENAAL
jgi:hypothetical protein